MSVESMAIALHHSRATGTAKLVLIGIANHDGDGGAWPSMATLAKYGGVDKRNAQKACDRLESLGEIRRIYQQGGDHSMADQLRPNLYRFLLECPRDCDRSKNHRTKRDSVVSTEIFELSTRVTVATPGDGSDRGTGDGSDRGTGDGSDTQTEQVNHLLLVKETGPSTRAEGKEDALSGDAIESPVERVETSAERYSRLVHEKCPKVRNRKHDFRFGPCGWCGAPKPSLYSEGAS